MLDLMRRQPTVSRRTFLRASALTTALAIAGGVTSCQQIAQITRSGPVKITWAGQSAAYMLAVQKFLWEPFQKANNVQIEFVASPTTATLARLRAEKGAPSFDFLATGEGVSVTMRIEGLVDKMDANNIPNLANVPPAFRNDQGYPPQGAAIANVIYYNSDYVKNPPTSWADLWRPEFKGKVSFPDIANTTGLHLLLMAAKIAQGDTTINSGEQFVNDKAFAKMKELLPNTYTIWGLQTSFDGMASLKSGEVWLAVDGLAGQRKTVLEVPGTPIRALVNAKEGIPNSPLTLGIVTGHKAPTDLLTKLINEHLTPAVELGVADLADFVPTIDVALPASLSLLPKPGAMLKTDWNVVNTNRPAWTDRWNKEILAAKG
jgi:putative spermidine/putrescine transport system substrate-binding protein